MAQYYSRICNTYKDRRSYITVRDRLERIKLEKYGFLSETVDLFKPKGQKHQAKIEEMSLSDEQLLEFVREISKKIRSEGIIVADNTNLNVNPYTFGVYYFGDNVNTYYFEEPDERCNICDEIKIGDTIKWAEKGIESITEKEYKIIKKFGLKMNIDVSLEEVKKPHYRYDGMIIAAFRNKEEALEAYKKWDIFFDGRKSYSVYDLMHEREHCLLTVMEQKCMLEYIPIGKQDMEDYIIRKNIFESACVMGVSYCGIGSCVDVVYSFGEGIKVIDVEVPKPNIGYLKHGTYVSEVIDGFNIQEVFREKIDLLSEGEKDFLKVCQLWN